MEVIRLTLAREEKGSWPLSSLRSLKVPSEMQLLNDPDHCKKSCDFKMTKEHLQLHEQSEQKEVIISVVFYAPEKAIE